MRCIPGVSALEARALLSTLTVTNHNDSGTGSLRAALASAVSGDKIDFASSAYGTIKLSSGPLVVDTSVTIDGPGADKVTISGNNRFQDLQVQANVTATVSGLTITDGTAPTTYPDEGGGGIYNAGTLTLANCVVSNNNGGVYGVGAGILNNGTLVVTGSSITNNTTGATGFGGGGILNNGTLTITNSVVSNNTGDNGGGIFSGNLLGQGNVTITGSVVSNNAAMGGGGLALFESTATISRSTFSNNTAGNSTQDLGLGGGIQATGGNVNIASSQFVDNSAVAAESEGLAIGGGIWLNSVNSDPFPPSNLNISNSSFVGNTTQATFSYAGGVDAELDTNVTVSGSSFIGNTATGDLEAGAGALRIANAFSQPAQASISGSTFLDNGAFVPSTSTYLGGDAQGGAILSSETPLTISGSSFIANQVSDGIAGGYAIGGAIADFSSPALNLSNSLLMNNSATGGPALSMGSGAAGWGIGGGLVAFFDTATIENTSFFGNQAIGGAASQAGNQAGNGFGGGFQNEGSTVTMTNCAIQFNQAIGGAATDGATAGNGQGGGIENEGTLNVTGGVISINQAIGGAGGGDGEGGGIYTDGTTTLIGVLVTLNQADGGSDGGEGIGGGLYINSGTTTLEGKTKVIGNSASTSNNDIYGTYST